MSHCSVAAALAAPSSMLDAGGALGVSADSAPPLTAATPVSISVRPAFAMVGSVEVAGVASVSGGAGCACATSSTQASSAAKGASSSAACLICASVYYQYDPKPAEFPKIRTSDA